MKNLEIPGNVSPATDDGSTVNWHEFLAEALSKRLSTYRGEPKRIISDAETERATRKDYSGREILEMAQNADDAASEADATGTVLCECNEDALFIANTGRSFSPGGLESIMLAHTSPKRRRRGRLIGAKGLGFRSLLNWTDRPLIMSGSLEVGFAPEIARQCLLQLFAEVSEARIVVEAEGGAVPVLSFPTWSDFSPWDPGVVERCRALRESYDTVIAVPLIDGGSRDKVVEQLEALMPRLLLFMNATRTWRIAGTEVTNRAFTCEHRIPTSKSKGAAYSERRLVELVEEDDGKTESNEDWVISIRQEDIPEELRSDEDDVGNSLQIATGLLRGTNNQAPLSCYFPTSERMPLIGMFHATVELDKSRERILDTSLSRYALSRLAQLHAEFLEIAAKDRIIKETLPFMVPQYSDSKILRMFQSEFIEAARSRRLIKTRRGRYVRASEACLFPNAGDSFSDGRWFPDHVDKHDQKQRNLLEQLKVPKWTESEVVAYLSERRFVSDLHLAAVIHKLSSLNYTCPELAMLLKGERGGAGTSSSRWFPPVARRKRVKLDFPSYVAFRFISESLWSAIKAQFDGEVSEEDLVKELSHFGVVRFDFQSALQEICGGVDAVAGNEARLEKRRQDLFRFLSSAFVADFNAPDLSSIQLLYPNRDGQWLPTTKLHIADEIVLHGRVNAVLYAKRPDLLAAPLETVFADAALKSPAAFLSWIGVNEWPGRTSRALTYTDFELLVACYPQMISFRQKGVHEEELSELALALYGGKGLVGETGWILGLEDVLSCGSDEAILAWIYHRGRRDLESLSTTLQIRPTPQSTLYPIREEPSSPLALEYVARSAWLRDSSGEERAPRDLLLPSRRHRSLPVPLLASPIVGPERFGITKDSEEMANLFEFLGVSRSPSDATALGMLSALEAVSKQAAEHEEVLRLYRALGRSPRVRETTGTPAAKEKALRFRSEGRIYATGPDGFGWYSVRDVRYANVNEVISLLLSRHFAIFPVNVESHGFLDVLHLPVLRADDILIQRILTEDVHVSNGGILVRERDACLPAVRLWCELADLSLDLVSEILSCRFEVSAAAAVHMQLKKNDIAVDLPIWKGVMHEGCFHAVTPPDVERGELHEVVLQQYWSVVADTLKVPASDRESFLGMLRASTGRSREVALVAAFPELSSEDVASRLGQVDLPEEWVTPLPRLAPIDRYEENDGGAFTSGVANLNVAAVHQQAETLLREVGGKTTSDPNLSWTEAPKPPPSPGKPVSRRGTDPSHSHRLSLSSTGRNEEEIAFAFEVSQGRIPRSVAQVQGEDGFGCDIISFATDEDRLAFDASGDLSKVTRFIEVKKSSVPVLRRSQTEAAKRLRKRYFVYQVGEGKILTYQDPAAWVPESKRLFEIDAADAPEELIKSYALGDG